MGNSFAIHALRCKRARLAGEIDAARRAIARQCEALATLDAGIRMFEPDSNPNMIAPIRSYVLFCGPCGFRIRGGTTREPVATL